MFSVRQFDSAENSPKALKGVYAITYNIVIILSDDRSD